MLPATNVQQNVCLNRIGVANVKVIPRVHCSNLIGIRVWQISVLFKVSCTRRGSLVDNLDPCTTRATPLRPPGTT
eukprot:3240967-Rhodomonas_salina.1